MFHLKLIVHLISFPFPSCNIPAVLKTQCRGFLTELLRGTSKPELTVEFLPKVLTQDTEFSEDRYLSAPQGTCKQEKVQQRPL